MYHFMQPDNQSIMQEILFNIQNRVSAVKIECKIIDEKNEKLQRENNDLLEKIRNFVNQSGNGNHNR